MENKQRAPEQRTIDVDVQDIDTRGRTLHGYAAVYNVESDDLGGFRERIAPGAFGSVLDADVRALLNHDPSQVLGRTKSGTLRLHDEQRGLRFEVDLPDSPLGANVREAVRRKDIDGASFRFTVDRESWQGDLRTVESVKELKDVTVATFGAYPAASVELRTKPETNEATQKEQGAVEEQNNTEERTEEARPPAGSLRVEERTEAPIFRSLADMYADRGFFENRSAEVGWDEFRAIVWGGGTVLDTLNPLRRDGVALGFDSRWLFPVLPQTAVSDATTSVQYLRQSGRTLAGTAVLRPLDATSTKPSVAGTAELVSSQLQQVAAIHPDIPRIHAAQPLFQSIVETDLRLSINDGLDELVRRGVVTAGTAAAVTGNIVDKVRKAKTVVQAAGYNPNVLAIDPAGAEALDLLKTSGSEAMYVFAPGQAAPAPWGLQMRVWKTAGTAIIDADSFGRLYVAPVELRSFEQDAGATNRQTVRMETNALYTVERVAAGLKIL
jgi:HK97 family phage prohead protease